MIKVDYITLTELQIKGRQAKQTSYVLANISSLFRSVKIQFYKDYISYYITLKNFFLIHVGIRNTVKIILNTTE